jgi:hypothetical protein
LEADTAISFCAPEIADGGCCADAQSMAIAMMETTPARTHLDRRIAPSPSDEYLIWHEAVWQKNDTRASPHAHQSLTLVAAPFSLRWREIAAAAFVDFRRRDRYIGCGRKRRIGDLARQLGCRGTGADQAEYRAAPVAPGADALKRAGFIAGQHEVRPQSSVQTTWLVLAAESSAVTSSLLPSTKYPPLRI